jgi:hypothetical protein
VATPTLREAVLHSHASGTSASVTTGAGTAIGDVIITAHGSDFYAASGMAAPTGTAGITWTLVDTADLATNNSHMKVWWGWSPAVAPRPSRATRSPTKSVSTPRMS